MKTELFQLYVATENAEHLNVPDETITYSL
jgi:hypothetical protein